MSNENALATPLLYKKRKGRANTRVRGMIEKETGKSLTFFKLSFEKKYRLCEVNKENRFFFVAEKRKH